MEHGDRLRRVEIVVESFPESAPVDVVPDAYRWNRRHSFQ